MSAVVVYTKPSCVQCDATRRVLDRNRIAYITVDVTTHTDALALVRELGYLQAPVVVAGDQHWSGFRPDRITALAAAMAATGDLDERTVA